MKDLSRRNLLIGTAAGAVTGVACGPVAAQQQGAARQGRLTARPGSGPTTEVVPGETRLGLDERDAILFWPEDRPVNMPTPLMVVLHGFSSNGRDMLDSVRIQGRRAGVAMLAPTSRRVTWALEGGPVGPDAAFIDAALAATFERFTPSRIGVLGFSDGASYALSTGMTNGDLFSWVVALTPIRFAAAVSVGRPHFWISGGRGDRAAPYRNVEDMAHQLEGFGYSVELHAHRGGHDIDSRDLAEALQGFAAA